MTVSYRNPAIIPKSIMPILYTENELKNFREQLYERFEHRADSTMDLLDAICSNNHAPSVVQLSLNPLFRAGYSTLFKAIGESLSVELSKDSSPLEGTQFQCVDLISQVVPQPKQRHFFLMGQDCTSIARPFAKSLEDRGLVHQPTQIKGNKPITIGHSYSLLAVLPERSNEDAPWTIPLDMSRVPTESNSTQQGIAQLNAVLTNPNMPWTDELCALVVDSAYGNHKFLTPLQEHTNLVTIARSRSNRVFYQSPIHSGEPPRKGHPQWYGERFALQDEETWHESSEIEHTSYQTRRGRKINITITAWHNMLMRGTKALPTYQNPFTLVRIVSMDESGKPLFKPMWLIIMGKRRSEISLIQANESYRQRFDLEHTFRFKKQNLLLSDFETPDVEHEQNWVYLVMLAYVELWAAHFLAVTLLRPWERDVKTDASARISPSKVQQDWNRIISQLGTPAAAPKPRGKSPGRQSGQTQTARPRFSVVKKGKSRKAKAPIVA
jgi:DDE superfamily endonuclease